VSGGATLQLIVDCRAKQVAATLGISARTVEFHKYQMMNRLELQSSAELVGFAIKHGIVSI
jgi:DNA-binding NarL/FixJ family response regulator